MKNLEPAIRTSARLRQSLEQAQEVFREMADEVHETLVSRASRCDPFVELEQSLPSQIQAISPFTTQFMRLLARFRKVDGREIEIEMALREALANAVLHGNHEDPHKRVYIGCRCSVDNEVSITVRDQGQGFDSRAIPDPTTADGLHSEHGRGIYMMRAFMDEVSFEEGGTVVCMRKKSNLGPAAQRKTQRMEAASHQR